MINSLKLTMAAAALVAGVSATAAAKSAPVAAPERSFSMAAMDTAPIIVELFKVVGMSNDLSARLKAETQRAVALGRTPVLEFSASRCTVCRLLDASFQHPRMRDVLRDMYVIRVDVDVWKTQLASVGFRRVGDIPVLMALGVDGRTTGQMWSGAGMALDGDPSLMRPEYDAAYVEQVAIALKQFFSSCQREFFRTMIS